MNLSCAASDDEDVEVNRQGDLVWSKAHNVVGGLHNAFGTLLFEGSWKLGG